MRPLLFGGKMPITRQGPIMNMDTEQPLRMAPPTQRFTRAQAHRLLKIKNIPHDASGTMEYLMMVCRMHNVALEMPPSGIIENKEEKKPEPPRSWMDEQAKDGYPKQIGKLKALCKARGIKFTPKAKRADLVKMLNAV